MLFFNLIVFLFGLIAGSFLNCVIYRLEKEENPLKGHSYCPNCKHTLDWQDLVPIFSFLLLKGRCRYCGKKISYQYPLVELLTGFLFVFIFWHLGFSFDLSSEFQIPNFFYLSFVSCFLVIIFVYDLKRYIIPDVVVYPAIVVSGIWYLVAGIFFKFYTKYEILNTIYSVVGAAAFFLVIVLISKGKWMGIGDIKLAFFMGLFLSWPNILVALFSAFFIGAIIGVILIIFGKKTLKSEVPFGPFLVAGTFLALFWGQNIANWYLNLIF